MKFSQAHEWADVKEGIATCGISQFAQAELGQIVYVELPKVGIKLQANGEAVVLESTKAAADIYAPLSGEVVEVNQSLTASPEKINSSPEKEGWIYKLKISDPKEYDALMSSDEYHRFIKE